MFDSNEEHLFPFLLKNLPSNIHCSNNKSGAFSKASVLTHIALKNYNFIEFNSKKRISIVVFDKDKHEDMTALEHFNDIPTFYEWLIDKINIVPTYICQTTKGFQFAFVIKGFMTVEVGYNPKNSPQYFLSDIKSKYIKYLQLDEIASSRNNAIFRNPLKHKYIAFTHKIYDLNDLNNVIKEIVFDDSTSSYNKSNYLRVSKYEKIYENRNSSLFKLSCREFAYSKATKKDIFNFINTLNLNNCHEPLPLCEIKSITNSIYKRCQENSLKSGSKKAQLNREKLVKQRKKEIIKYFLNCKKENTKPIKAELARKLNITVQSLNSTYGDFIRLKYKI